MIGLGSLVRAFIFFLVLPTPRSVLGLGWFLFARVFAFLPSRRLPHSVRGHGLGNRAAKQRHGTGLGSFFFFLCVVLPTPSSAPSRGGGQGNLATHRAQDCMFGFLFFVVHVVLFSLVICVFG